MSYVMDYKQVDTEACIFLGESVRGKCKHSAVNADSGVRPDELVCVCVCVRE